MPRPPLASPSDVETVWRSLTGETEQDQIEALIRVASSKLRQATPFDIDARIALYEATPDTDPMPVTALDPELVANVVATIVKRFLDNREGAATISEGIGGYSRSTSYVGRFASSSSDKSGSDVRGSVQVIASDVDQLRPAVKTRVPGMIQLRPTRQMNPSSQWSIGYPYDPSTGLPDPETGYYPNGYDPTYDPDPSDDVTT